MTQVRSASATKAGEGSSPKARSQQKSDSTTRRGSSCFNNATSAGSTLPSRTRRCTNDSATDDIAIHFAARAATLFFVVLVGSSSAPAGAVSASPHRHVRSSYRWPALRGASNSCVTARRRTVRAGCSWTSMSPPHFTAVARIITHEAHAMSQRGDEYPRRCCRAPRRGAQLATPPDYVRPARTYETPAKAAVKPMLTQEDYTAVTAGPRAKGIELDSRSTGSG